MFGGAETTQRDLERQILPEQRLEQRERAGKANREELKQLIDPRVGGLHNPEDGRSKLDFGPRWRIRLAFGSPALRWTIRADLHDH